MKVLLIFRSPVGGLFRHIRDLLSGLHRAGHNVGVVFDAEAPLSDSIQDSLLQMANLGLNRFPISKLPSVGDIAVLRSIAALHEHHHFDVVHGHGAKGGLYARLLRCVSGQPPASVYTLHGGSLHYRNDSLAGRSFLWAERRLLSLTDGLIFESAFTQRSFMELIDLPTCPFRIIYNGLHASEFAPCRLETNEFDFVFLGELRFLKGVDVLLRAMSRLQSGGREARLAVFGSGPDEMAFRKLSVKLGLRGVEWLGAVSSAREALCRGGCLVFPSRAESFPYVGLEAVGMHIPIIATRVGGLPEILGEDYPLLSPGNDQELAAAMIRFLDGRSDYKERCELLAKRAQEKFLVDRMVEETIAFYCSIKKS